MSSAYATSDDGLDWKWHGTVLAGRPGAWDARGARLTSVLPDGRASYDGRATAAENWFERTGLVAARDEPVADVRYLDVLPLAGRRVPDLLRGAAPGPEPRRSSRTATRSRSCEIEPELERAVAAADGPGAESPHQRRRGHVVPQRAAGQAADAVRARIPGCDARGQRRAEAASVPVVGNRDGDVGGVVRSRPDGVAGDADHPAVDRVERHDRLVGDVIDVGQVRQLALGQRRLRPEEPPVARLRAEPCEPVGERVTVTRPDRRACARASRRRARARRRRRQGLGSGWNMAVSNKGPRRLAGLFPAAGHDCR